MSESVGQALHRALTSKGTADDEIRDAYVGVVEWLDRTLVSLGIEPSESTRAELAQAVALVHRKLPPSRPGLVPVWGLECFTGELKAVLPGSTASIVMGPDRSNFFICRAMRIAVTNSHDPLDRRSIDMHSIHINQEPQLKTAYGSPPISSSMFAASPGMATGIRFTKVASMANLIESLVIEYTHPHDVPVDTKVEIYGDPINYRPRPGEFADAFRPRTTP